MVNKGILLEHIKPGTPTQNAYVERFNRHFREDVLDAYIFGSLSQVNIICGKWKDDYNDNHPHKSLGKISPRVFEELQVIQMNIFNLKPVLRWGRLHVIIFDRSIISLRSWIHLNHLSKCSFLVLDLKTYRL